MSDFILQIRVYDYMHIVAYMINNFSYRIKTFSVQKNLSKSLETWFCNIQNIKYIYIQMFLVSKCNSIRNVYIRNYELRIMNWALIVTITERNQKDFLRLSETRLRYSLLLGQQNRLISTLQLINIANVFSYRHTMLIRPWHSLNINQFHSHSFVFNRRLVYFFKNSL